MESDNVPALAGAFWGTRNLAHYKSICKFFCPCTFPCCSNGPEVPIHIGVTAPIHFSSACGQINRKSLITYWVHRKQICRSLDQRMCLWPPKLKLPTYKSSLPVVCEEFCNDWCVGFDVKISLHRHFSPCFPLTTAALLALSLNTFHLEDSKSGKCGVFVLVLPP